MKETLKNWVNYWKNKKYDHPNQLIRLYREWTIKSAQIRRGKVCNICGKKAVLTHHPKAREFYNSCEDYVNETDLTPLCFECHSNVHNIDWILKYYKEMGIKPPDHELIKFFKMYLRHKNLGSTLENSHSDKSCDFSKEIKQYIIEKQKPITKYCSRCNEKKDPQFILCDKCGTLLSFQKSQ